VPRILIFTDEPDWHARRLLSAFARRGAIATTRSLRQCAFVLAADGPRIAFGDQPLPDAVLVRMIATGSFEQVTLRLSFLHALSLAGVPVINDARAIERCVDKSMTSFLLHRAGIPTPLTIVSEDPSEATRALARRDCDWVVKPLFGSQGRGLVRLAAGSALPPAEEVAGVYYLQKFVGRPAGWRDLRVMVIGGKVVTAMLRHGASWITNVHQGARCEATPVTARLAELSLAAAAAVGADYAGVDLIETDDGELLVLEVNSMPAWQGLQRVATRDVALALADHVLERIA